MSTRLALVTVAALAAASCSSGQAATVTATTDPYAPDGRDYGHAPDLTDREAAFCAKVGGRWLWGTDCDVTYSVEPGHGWAGYSQTYRVQFDEHGDPVGARHDCPGRFWHPDTHICEDHAE